MPDPEKKSTREAYNRFWTDVICKGMPTREDLFRQWPGSEAPKGFFISLLVQIRQWNRAISWRDQLMAEQLVRDEIVSIFQLSETNGGSVRIDSEKFIAILPEGEHPGSLSALAQGCYALSGILKEKVGCEIVCFCHSPLQMDQLFDAVDRLIRRSWEDSGHRNFVVVNLAVAGHPDAPPPWIPPDTKHIFHLLLNEEYDRALTEIGDSFLPNGTPASVSRIELMHFIQNFNQMFYLIAEQRDVRTGDLFCSEYEHELYKKAADTAGDALLWCFWSVTKLSEYLEEEAGKESYVGQAKEFIRMNLDRSFTRKDIADHVHLSQNYLARLFKKETGSSVSDYVIRTRMETAAELLRETDLSVSDVAARCGYDNFSYFLTLFKRMTNLRPSEYRRQFRDENGKENR